MDNIISAKNVTFKYDDETPDTSAALKNLSLDIERGSFTVILGHNGSGKSTLAKLLNGLLRPDEGKVLVDSMSTADDSNEFEIRRRVGMIFQNPDNQIVCSIVEEDVAFGPENMGIEPSEIRKRVDSALETVNMTKYCAAAPYHLSGGQKQRIAIAGILAMKPECIVLDEPTAMLDPIGRKEVMETITALNKENSITVVLITHFMEEAEKADRVIVMDSGSIVLDGNPKSVFSNSERIKKAGLALPQTTELLEKLNSLGIKTEKGIISADDTAAAVYKALNGGTAK